MKAHSEKFIQAKIGLNKIKRTKFGISIPELRKFACKIANTDYREFLAENNFETHELKLLHAFVIGYIKDDIKTLLEYFEEFVPHVDTWDICDSLCKSFKITKKYPESVWDFIMQYKNSHKEFESRIVSVILLSHYLNDDYIDKVIAVLGRLNTDTYYSQMGVAWALATIMGKYPEKCLQYLESENCHLDSKTYNKTLQKIRESLLVPNEIRRLTKFMKK